MNQDPIFTPGEIARRWDAVLARCPQVDCVVAPSYWNSYYLSGLPMLQWGRSAVTILFRDGHATLVLPVFEGPGADRLSPIEDVRLYADHEGPALEVATARTAEAIAERGATTVGIEAAGMPAAMYLALARALPGAELVDVSDAIDAVRLVSSPEEHVYARLASDAATAALATVAELMAPGVEETYIAAQAQLAMERALPTEVQATGAVYMQQGERSIEAHARAMRVPIAVRTIVEVCCECEVWSYQAAAERAFIVGEPGPEAIRAYDAMLEAFNAASAAIRPGTTFAAVDAAARDVFHRAGYRNGTPGTGLVRNIIHSSGGRIAAGNLQPHNDNALEPGMVLTVEPWTLTPGVGAPRHCDTVLVTDDGHEVLTRFERGVIHR